MNFGTADLNHGTGCNSSEVESGDADLIIVDAYRSLAWTHQSRNREPHFGQWSSLRPNGRRLLSSSLSIIHKTPWRVLQGQSWCGGWQTDDYAWRQVYGNRSFATPNRDQDSDGQ